MILALCAACLVIAPVPEKKPALELTAQLDKVWYKSGEKVSLTFTLKNVSGATLWIGDGFLAPATEVGPGRHFELAVKNDDTDFRYWGRISTEGKTMGIRKVFKLKPGDTYTGGFVVSDGGLATMKTNTSHKLGVDSAKYTLKLVYQVNPKTHGVWQPPKDFDP